jgi:ribosomal-protein-alanine N-acetyltransferase
MDTMLETTRLWLYPLALADAIQVQELFPKWEIVRYLASQVPWPYPPDGARRFYSEVAIPAIERGDAWHWTLRLKSDPLRVIGGINLTKGECDNRGFWLGLPWQGQGFMSEACEATAKFWFDTLRFPVLRVHKAVASEASRRISIKQGMRIVAREERDFVSGRLPAEIWEITAEEWRARRHIAAD